MVYEPASFNDVN